jgi:hypothetical protein
MVEAALVIASPGRNAVDGDDATWQDDLPTMATMRAALEAVAPAIRAAALEEAAKAMDDWPCRAAAIRALKEPT